MEKISIILPVYNSEKYLEETIGSVIGQTYKNFELICINDGSFDSSLEILNNFKKLDNRITVIDQANAGGAEARNVGLKKAKGEYIAFLDSDDVYHPQYLEILYKVLRDNEADLSVCDYVEFKSEHYRFRDSDLYDVDKIEPKRILYSPFYDKFVRKKKVKMYMWLKLAHRKVYENIEFNTSLPVMNDTMFWIETLYHSRRCVTINEKLIAYRVRPDSISHIELSFERVEEYYNSILEYNKFLNNTKMSFFERLAMRRVIAKNVYYIYFNLLKGNPVLDEHREDIARMSVNLWKTGYSQIMFLSPIQYLRIRKEFRKMKENLGE